MKREHSSQKSGARRKTKGKGKTEKKANLERVKVREAQRHRVAEVYPLPCLYVALAPNASVPAGQVEKTKPIRQMVILA